MDKKTAEAADGAEMTAATERVSSRIFEMIGLRARTTQARAKTMGCSGYEPEGRVHQTNHPWSVYDVPFADLETAFAAMRTSLPESGWKITSDGPDKSRAKSPTLRANSPDGDFSVELQLLNRENQKPKGTSLINVTVVSRCFEDSSA
ncbi:hypothetical protein QCN29_00455 [Streptomyces sp. HNM0663]|uniref:Uncharacterized protein n=1 Tax=Streptomyces chengmaiensis TaxID=3040919 RepID=A0ABT6HG80_9ACTN|nr:hypothetical protein [Streptomyces chengmaiensis]MDH2387280.1 hypothetical protein [Streptomyces chengmaiensis]